jgi:hypothetical protein
LLLLPKMTVSADRTACAGGEQPACVRLREAAAASLRGGQAEGQQSAGPPGTTHEAAKMFAEACIGGDGAACTSVRSCLGCCGTTLGNV